MNAIGYRALLAWCVLNALPGIGSLVYLAMGHHAPGLRMRFAPDEIEAIESRALATVDGLAVLLNTLIAVYCLASFEWLRATRASAPRSGESGALRPLLIFGVGTGLLQVAGYVVDLAYFQGKNLAVLHVSTLWLAFGLWSAARPATEGSA